MELLFGIGGTDRKNDVMESMADMPQNRTLLAIKLTNEYPVQPEIVQDLRTIADVFDYYRPTVPVTLIMEDGATINGDISFEKLEDFGVKGLESKNELLQL